MFRVERIAPKDARAIIVKHHYSHAWPTGNFVSFGAFIDGKIVGVVTYGHPANKNAASGFGVESARDVCELTRLWVADWAPKFIESRAIAATLRKLKGIRRIAISYADPAQSHVGTVYQASNWTYLGQMSSTSQLRMPDGSHMHKRAAYDRFGTDDAQRLGLTEEKFEGKHKYAYAIDASLRLAIQKRAKPYPRLTDGVAQGTTLGGQFESDPGAPHA